VRLCRKEEGRKEGRQNQLQETVRKYTELVHEWSVPVRGSSRKKERLGRGMAFPWLRGRAGIEHRGGVLSSWASPSVPMPALAEAWRISLQYWGCVIPQALSVLHSNTLGIPTVAWHSSQQ
jgi:hypothetical protein